MVLVALDPRGELLEHPMGGPTVPLPHLWEALGALNLKKFLVVAPSRWPLEPLVAT